MKKFIITAVLVFTFVTTASAAPLKPTTLRIGSTGETVKVVQRKLVDLGLSESAVDGKYGRKTAAAVAKFQLSKNLKSDGLVGEKTLAMILASKTPSTNQSTSDSSLLTSDTVSVSRITKPIIDVPVVIPDVPLPDEIAWRKLCRDGQPHIQVLSPNGGEVYSVNQQIPIKWRSCNAPLNTSVMIALDRGNNGIMLNPQNLYFPSETTSTPTQNDGYELATIDPSFYQSNYGVFWVQYGTLYKVRATLAIGTSLNNLNTLAWDVSDNLFTINAPITDMCPNISGVQTTIPSGMIRDSAGNCVQQDSWTALCADGQPHIEILSPNGGEVYQIGGQMSLGWKTCNISQTNNVWLHLLSQDNNGVIQTIQLGVNDGTQVITLLGGITDPSFTPITPGMYKARIGTLHPNTQWDVVDDSDNLFTINAPSVVLSAASGNQLSNSAISVNLGDTFTISGTPQGLQGMTYGSGPGQFTMSYNFVQAFGDNNNCRNNESTPAGPWIMTCRAQVAGSSTFYVAININDREVYRSNVVTVTIKPSTSTDMCPNISGVQTTIPAGMIKDSTGNCVTGGITSSTWDVLCRDGQPHVQVLSPNGGEVYQFEQQIPVTWKSCNSGSNIVMVGLTSTDNTSVNGELATVGNSGSTTVIVPKSGGSGNVLLASGNFYKIFVALSGSTTLRDYSDSLFTMNQPGILNPKTTIPSSAY